MEALRILQAPAAHPAMSINKLLILLLLACPLAQATEPQVSSNLPPAPQTREEAKQQQRLAADMRREADGKRSEAEAIYKRDDVACYAKFLVNSCRDKVRAANIERMKVVRQLEIDANQLERRAKSRILEIDSTEKSAPTPTLPPMPTEKAPQRELPPGGTPVQPPPLKPAPAPAPSAEAQAKESARRQASAAEAEKARQEREADAAERAARARADAERYDQRARENAAKKAGKSAASAPQ